MIDDRDSDQEQQTKAPPPQTSIMDAETAIDAEAKERQRLEQERAEHEEYVQRALGTPDTGIYFDPRQMQGIGFKPHLQPSSEELQAIEDAHKSHTTAETRDPGHCVICQYEDNQAKLRQPVFIGGATLEQRAAAGVPMDGGGEAGTAGSGQTTSTSGDTAGTGGGGTGPTA